MLSGDQASNVPNDIFISALKDHGVFKNNDTNNVNVLIPKTKRKRFVFGDLYFKHRQSFEMNYMENIITFLLIDQNDDRSEITLLHMPLRTTPAAIEFIFKTLNDAWVVSDIKHAPGKERRLDRWQCLLQCDDKSTIPHSFILPKMSPDNDDLTVKVFVNGRNAPCFLCNNDNHSPDQCPLRRPPPPPPAAAPVPAARVPGNVPPAAATPAGVSRHAADTPEHRSHHYTSDDWEALLTEDPDFVKKTLIQISRDKTGILIGNIENIIHGLMNTQTIQDVDAGKFLKQDDNNLMPQFTSVSPKGIENNGDETSKEQEEKAGMVTLFLHLFASTAGIHENDLRVMHDFMCGKSSLRLFFKWLCQWAVFTQTNARTEGREILIKENEDI